MKFNRIIYIFIMKELEKNLPQTEKDFCFCTLALAKRYRVLALLLAKDIEKYSSNTSFVILTDRPGDFSNQPNVVAFKHRQQSVECYHDKRFAIAQALQMFNSCIFIDADMRIISQVPPDIKWLPGITARTGSSIIKHNQNRVKAFAVIQEIAQKLNLDLNSTKFVHEFLFTVTRDSGKEIEFLKHWGMLAPYFELKGVYRGEGNAIGLAAAQAGLPVRFDSIDRFDFFKDTIEKERLKKGQVILNEKMIYLEQQKTIEHPNHSLMNKLTDKIIQKVTDLYRLAILRILTWRNRGFYYSSSRKY